MRVRVLFCLVATIVFCIGTPLTAQHQQPSGAPLGEDRKAPKSIDAEYRKFDELASFLRARNAKQFAINSARGIDEASYVPIGGIEQWVTIRGEDRVNPVLLFLHGGPGDVTNPWSFATFAPWETRFTVVQWTSGVPVERSEKPDQQLHRR